MTGVVQDIYFPRWSSLTEIEGVYNISSILLFTGVIIFGIIFLIACVALVKVVKRIRTVHHEQKVLHAEMESFYKKQLKDMVWKPFFHSLYQYVKLLVELRKWKDMRTIRHYVWYDDATIQYIENVVLGVNEVDSHEEKRIKDILSYHLAHYK